MLRRGQLPLGAIAVGAALGLAILAIGSTADVATTQRDVSTAVADAQTRAAAAIGRAGAAAAALSAQLQPLGVAADESGSLGAAETAFARIARMKMAESEAIEGFVFFQRVEQQSIAEAISRGTAEGMMSLRAETQTAFLPARLVVRREGGAFGFKAEDGRLPLNLVASDGVQGAIRAAIDGRGVVASPIMAETPGGVAEVGSIPATGGRSAAFWLFEPVFADPGPFAASGPMAGFVGVVGALIDAEALRPQLAADTGMLYSPAGRAMGESRGVNGVWGALLASLTGARISEGTAVAIGPQQFLSLAASDSGGGLLSGGVSSLILALLAGGGLAFAQLRSQDKLETTLNRYKSRVQKDKAEHRRRERDLANSEERFRTLAESTKVIPWAANLTEKRFTYIGPQIEQLTGYPVKSWMAHGYFVDHVHPSDRREFIVEGFSRLKVGQYDTREYRIRAANGAIMHMRNMLTLVADEQSGEGGVYAQGFMLDITAEKTAQMTLEAARKEAEEANRSKSEFLANMSHELRTPLNAVIGFSEVMKDELFGPLGERYCEYAQSIHESGKHLLGLINDVLDLSKIEAGKIELVDEDVDLGSLLSNCRTLLHDRASTAGLHIRLEIPKPLPMLRADGRRLKQIILNLMSNSVKFTLPGGRLTLRAEVVEPKGLRILVGDTGIGMTKEEVDVALMQFGQIDSDLARQHDGTGLGLPIAKSLTELHGGSMEVTSKKGVGTTVTLWFPVTRILSAKRSKAS